MTNIFEYSNISDPNIYSDIRSYQNFDTNIFGYSFVPKIFIQIYSDIRLCHFLDTNIFGYSFVSKSIRMSHSGVHCNTSFQECSCTEEQSPQLKIYPWPATCSVQRTSVTCSWGVCCIVLLPQIPYIERSPPFYRHAHWKVFQYLHWTKNLWPHPPFPSGTNARKKCISP